jgi:hypothetical protein
MAASRRAKKERLETVRPQPAPERRPGLRPWQLLVLALASAGAVLAFHSDTYWRPFDDSPQESVVSFHAFGFAAANGAGLWPNPFVARDIDVRESRIRPYPHWPNGFFLLFELVLRTFGRTEVVGRWFAILGTMLGFTLIVVSVGERTRLLYAALPLILLSSSGRDSVPFVFLDVAQYVWIGALLWITAHLSESRHYNGIFRAATLAALFFNQLVLPYAAVIIILKWTKQRSARDLILDCAALGAGGVSIMLAMAAGAGSIDAGRGELIRIFRYRASQPLGDWSKALAGELRDGLHLGWAGIILVAAAWVVCLRAREWRIVSLAPSYLLFGLVLREYVTMHHFARLLLVFFCLATLLAGAELAAAFLGPRLRAAVLAAGMIGLAARLAGGVQQYQPNRGMQMARSALVRMTSDPVRSAALARCNAFQFNPDYRDEHFDPFDRMGQFFFGPQIVERVRQGTAIRRCRIDFEGY